MLGTVVVGTVVVVLGAPVVVVGTAVVVEDGVAVSDGCVLLAGVCVSVFVSAGVPGLAGVVLTPEVGAFGVLSDV